MDQGLVIIERILVNLLANWSVSLQRWSDEQDQAFLRIAQIGAIDIRIALGAMALYILGSAERLGNLLLSLFQDIPETALETALELVLETVPRESEHQVVKRSTAIQDTLKTVVAGGLSVARLDFPLGIKITELILKFKKLLNLLGSRSAQSIYLKLIPNPPIRFALAALQVASVVWKGIASVAFLCLLWVVVRRIALGEILVPLFQGKRRKRIRLRSYARIPPS